MIKIAKSIGFFVVFQVVFIVLFGIFCEFNEKVGLDDPLSPNFMNVHVMLLIGFGFVMTFLKSHGYGSIGSNFLIAAVVFEWSILMLGWISMIRNKNSTFQIDSSNLLDVDFCAASVLVSLGIVIGKITMSQQFVMCIIQVVIQSFNKYICEEYIKIHDPGNSIYIFVFGAFFGLAVSRTINLSKFPNKINTSSYNSNLFAMIGTLFLWIYWPSFNSANAVLKSNAFVNTYFSLSASCITTFIISLIIGKGKLNMTHIQNASLAGGVAIGAVADVVSRPVGSVIIGSFSGIVCTLGLKYVNLLLKKIKAHDSTGMFVVFGLSGLISAIASGIIAALANENNVKPELLYLLYPPRYPLLENRTSLEQGGFQISALLLTIGMSIVGGLFTGVLLRFPIFNKIEDTKDMFDDEHYWHIDEDFFFSFQKYGYKENLSIRI